jgi:hypothetical protein
MATFSAELVELATSFDELEEDARGEAVDLETETDDEDEGRTDTEEELAELLLATDDEDEGRSDVEAEVDDADEGRTDTEEELLLATEDELDVEITAAAPVFW